jgi:predicted lipid-binding transport protein (Tim44 family)
MKRVFVALIATMTALAAIHAADADARRLSGGRSFGSQRSVTPSPSPSTTTPSGAASNPVMPAQPGTARSAPTPSPTPAPSAGSRWLGPIAGLAAGLGLAALFSHFGLSETFGSVLLLGLMVLVAFVVIRMFLARRTAPAAAAAGYGSMRTDGPRSTLDQSLSARRDTTPVFTAGTMATAASMTPSRRIPQGFDADGFVRQAKLAFTNLQTAYDRADRATLADLLTPEMQREVERDLAAPGVHASTEVVSLDADLLEVVTEGGQHWASVRFSGSMREDGDPVPQRFEEIWNLTKPVDGSVGWRLAGIQQTAQA